MLITFEGIDGAGKSTQIAKLVHFMTHEGIEVLSLREPGGTPTAENIRQLLLDSKQEISPEAELLLFSASRAELVQQVIKPALDEGKTVILDRFYDSTTAYQGYGRGINRAFLKTLISFSITGITPDITFYLDITPEEAWKRKSSKVSIPLAFPEEQLDRMEQSGRAFYQAVYEGYQAIMREESTRIVRLDALASIEHIHQHIITILRERFPL